MVIELGGSVFEITHDLVGDLFRAKNAGVTPIRGTHLSASISINPSHPTPPHPHHFLCSPLLSSTAQGGETGAYRRRPPLARRPPTSMASGRADLLRVGLQRASERCSGARANLRHRPQELPAAAAGESLPRGGAEASHQRRGATMAAAGQISTDARDGSPTRPRDALLPSEISTDAREQQRLVCRWMGAPVESPYR
jgi:hypothetical protein